MRGLDSLLDARKGERAAKPHGAVHRGRAGDTLRHGDHRSETLALLIPDELVERVFERAHELGLIEEPRRWAELDGAAAYLGVSRRRVYDLRARGLPAKLIGKRLLFDLRAVDAWLEQEGWEG